jgi:hypothetical protein
MLREFASIAAPLLKNSSSAASGHASRTIIKKAQRILFTSSPD